MTPISSTEDKLPLQLHVRQQFAAYPHQSLGEILSILRQRMARELAEMILKHPKMFEIKIDGDYGMQRADIIVMTQQEYADLMREQFKKGVQHAQGFMTTNWMG